MAARVVAREIRRREAPAQPQAVEVEAALTRQFLHHENHMFDVESSWSG
jgi:hypothetical protein